MLIFHKLLNLPTIKNFCFNLSHTHPWECTAQILKRCFISIQCLDKLLHKTKFYMQGRNNNLLRGNQGLMNDVFVAHNHLFFQRLLFFSPVLTFSSAIHQQRKLFFCISTLLAQKKVYYFSVYTYLLLMLKVY